MMHVSPPTVVECERWSACRFISEQTHPQTCFETSSYAKFRDGPREEPLIPAVTAFHSILLMLNPLLPRGPALRCVRPDARLLTG
jgi:hypothetical protein